MFWSSHPVCIGCRLPRFCTFSILSILNLMWSWPFFYALLISQLSWFIPCNRSEFFTYIAFSATPSTFTFISRCIFHSHFPNSSQIPYIPHIPPATPHQFGSRKRKWKDIFFLNFWGEVILVWIESSQIWLWPSQKWPLLDVCTFPKRIWGGLLLRATLRCFSCC